MRTSVAGRVEADEQLSKSDRLFRAAISSFCSTTTATRLDATRLDQLAMPLVPLVSIESKRYAAAALSRCFPGPQGLIRRLAEEDVTISAPILVGSPILSDVDIIGLIGRHGLGHAAAVGCRANLNPNIASLVKALGVIDFPEPARTPARTIADRPAKGPAAFAPAVSTEPSAEEAHAAAPSVSAAPMTVNPAHVIPANVNAGSAGAADLPAPTAQEPVDAASVEAYNLSAAFDEVVSAEPGAAEDAARDRLRAMMRPAGSRAPSRAHPKQQAPLPPIDWEAARKAAASLLATGLSGQAALFHTAIADAFDLDFAAAAAIADDADTRRLATALKASTLPPAEAFLICALAFPPRFATTKAIRGFIELYASIDLERARRDVAIWRERAPRRDTAEQRVVPEVANTLAEQPPERALKAS